MSRWLAVLVGVMLGASLVLVDLSLPPAPGAHYLECTVTNPLANLSAWAPQVIVAAPYHGSVSVEVNAWDNTSFGSTGDRIQVAEDSGNVTALQTVATNWTIFETANASVDGPGADHPCSAPLVAVPSVTFQPAGVFPEFTLARNVTADTDLPWEFNASQMCGAFGYRPTCAPTATWDINLSLPVGSINTCSTATSQRLNESGSGTPVSVPFRWEGKNYSVPVDWDLVYYDGHVGSPGIGNSPPIETAGVQAWYNYTFLPDTGEWEYGYLPDMSSGALVFSYTSCPT